METASLEKILAELIKKTDKVKERGALRTDKEAIDEIREVKVQMVQLTRNIYSDSDKRLTDFERDKQIAAERDSIENKKLSDQTFMEEANTVRRYLLSMKTTIDVMKPTEENQSKLEKLKNQTEEKKIEAERRETVAETKFYGAFIEIIDRLRDQLKDEKIIKQDIIDIKNMLSDIKLRLEKST